MGKQGRLSREERRQRRAEKRGRTRHATYEQLLESWAANFLLDKEWRVFFDGATGPTNPGQSGYGAVLYRNSEEVDSRSQQIGHATNNIAEYRGLIAALEMALEHGASELVVCGDSQLVFKHVFRGFRVGTPHLVPLCDRAQELVKAFPFVADAWIRREYNVRADELSTVGIPKIQHYAPTSETTSREMRRCLDAILENSGVIRSGELSFVMKMDQQLDGPTSGMSPKQWKWLQDIESRIYRAVSLCRAKHTATPKPRLVKARGEFDTALDKDRT